MAAHLLAIILNGKPPGSFQFDSILLAPTDYNNIKAAPRKWYCVCALHQLAHRTFPLHCTQHGPFSLKKKHGPGERAVYVSR
jgi:hypothetical protein